MASTKRLTASSNTQVTSNQARVCAVSPEGSELRRFPLSNRIQMAQPATLSPTTWTHTHKIQSLKFNIYMPHNSCSQTIRLPPVWCSYCVCVSESESETVCVCVWVYFTRKTQLKSRKQKLRTWTVDSDAMTAHTHTDPHTNNFTSLPLCG